MAGAEAAVSVLVTGASGLLGRAIYKELVSCGLGYKVVGLCHSRVRDGLVQCDLTDKAAVKQLFLTYRPRVIIHAAAERKPDVVEREAEKTEQLNVSATQYLVDCAAAVPGSYLLYISTDYVFDGRHPPYTVDSEPNPLNKYGESKRCGEICILESNSKHATGHGILRVPILYGEVEHLGESAVTVLFNTLLQQPASDGNKLLLVDHYQRRYPTHVNDVALVCRQLTHLYLDKAVVSSAVAECSGIFHWSSTEESVTKYDMVAEMARISGLSMAHIAPDPGPPKPDATPRPYDVKLDISRLRSLGLGAQTPFVDGIKPCLAPFQ